MADASLERRMPLEAPQARRPIVNIASPTGSKRHFSLRKPQETRQQSRQTRDFAPSNSAICRPNSLASSAQVRLN